MSNYVFLKMAAADFLSTLSCWFFPPNFFLYNFNLMLIYYRFFFFHFPKKIKPFFCFTLEILHAYVGQLL